MLDTVSGIISNAKEGLSLSVQRSRQRGIFGKNVIVYDTDERKAHVSVLNPMSALGMIGKEV
jgi:hypothetical protein